jgi:hypothetical protein
MKQEVKPIHKFNNGQGATLCNNCSVIITEGLTKEVYCEKCKKENMKQTTVEWLCKQYHLKQDIEIVKQAKKMEKQQQDDFAIGFAEWCIKKRIDFFDSTEIGETYTINGFVSRYKMSELLEMFKKEKGL